jgi:hypothetical protein
MRSEPLDERDLAGAAGWKALLGGPADFSGIDRRALEAWAGRIGDLLSPALADDLLKPASRVAGDPLVQPGRAAKAGLYNRFLLQRQTEAVRLVRDSGVRFLCMKGFALAHLVYARPEARIVGDVDLLVAPQDLPKAAAALAERGFAAMPIASRFGFISEASFLPVVSGDGQVAVDLHVAPDAWPAGRALTAEAVFRNAVPFGAGGMDLHGPSPEHAFFLLITNTAKDRFGPEGVRKVVDAAMLLKAHPGLDWDEVGALAQRGGYQGALAAFLHLMELIGHTPGAPARLRQAVRRPFANREIGSLARLYRRAEVPQLGFWAKFRRELLLGPAPVSVLQINLKRLYGVMRPRTGLPPGMPERRGPRSRTEARRRDDAA